MHLGLLALLGGCWVTTGEIQSRIDAVGPVATDTSADADTDVDTDTDTDTDTGTAGGTPGGTVDLSCVEDALGSAVGDNVYVGTTASAGDDLHGECYSGPPTTGPDLAFSWVPPNSGCFAFDTSTAAFDSVVYVREGGCDGPEIACNDDVSAVATTSEVGVELVAGQTYVVVVDGFDGAASGTFALDVHPANLIVSNRGLGGSPDTFSGSTAYADDTLDPAACPYPSGADDVLTWTAPYNAVWRFSLDIGGTNFDSVLALLRQCTPDAFTCADVFPGGGGEVVYARLDAGEQVLIRIAGYYDQVNPPESGDWRLIIAENP